MLISSLKPTNIKFKTFLPLLIQQRLNPDSPSHYAQSYLHDKQQQRDDLQRLDAENQKQIAAYLENIQAMEQLTRLNTNLALLKKHNAAAQTAAVRTIDVEICALRIGDFKLVTFPGELTVEIGLRLKRASQVPHSFVAGYTNGYIYYTPTVAQRSNTGYAQEDCDCIVAPEWQRLAPTDGAQSRLQRIEHAKGPPCLRGEWYHPENPKAGPFASIPIQCNKLRRLSAIHV